MDLLCEIHSISHQKSLIWHMGTLRVMCTRTPDVYLTSSSSWLGQGLKVRGPESAAEAKT